MEQVSRMSAEVNKLIGINLLAGEGVAMPEVGSLYVTLNTQGRKRIEYSSIIQGTPLIDIIQQRAACTEEQAAEIYNRWKEEVYTPAKTVIGGVGELRTKSFITSESFSKQLNPQPLKTGAMNTYGSTGDKPAQKKNGNKVIIICIILAIIAAAGYFAYNTISKSKAEKARMESIARDIAMEQQRIADSIAIAQIKAQEAAEKEAATAQVSPRYRVVYGVYDLRSNVDVAIKRINDQYGKDRAKEYPFNGKTLVSMFESDDRRECQKFLMEYYELYPDTWIYDSEQ